MKRTNDKGSFFFRPLINQALIFIITLLLSLSSSLLYYSIYQVVILHFRDVTSLASFTAKVTSEKKDLALLANPPSSPSSPTKSPGNQSGRLRKD